MEKDQISINPFLNKIFFQVRPFNTMLNIGEQKKEYKI